jgi:SNF2 family DNA or RNA helicase
VVPLSWRRRFQILAAIRRLRQLACHPKLFGETSQLPSAKLVHMTRRLLELRELLTSTLGMAWRRADARQDV